MRKRSAFPLLVLLSIFSIFSHAHADQFKSTGTVDVYFSPDGGTTTAIVNKLNDAKSEILIQAYSFTSAPIAKALIEDRKRGIKIEAVIEKGGV